MSLAPGARLGAYEVISLLGVGGMGEVYRARDTRLNRDVAIKVLPDAFVHDADRLARFKREAQVLASLNHPHIAAIYGIEEGPADSPAKAGHYVLILELVDGPTLADRIARGPIPIDEAMPIARQIADALEAAHEQGIIHRDLKPANIKLTPDGRVKVLDFGLAKALDHGPADAPNASMSPTITSPAMTLAGVILGTAAYMSPEQAKGKPAQKRSDIWAFGCVLYEMLTAKRAFSGEDVSDTLAAVLRGEPDWTALPPAAPVALRRLLRRTLEKDRKRRLADIADARSDIDEALTTPGPLEAPGHRSIVHRRWLVPVASAAIGAGLCFVAFSAAVRPWRAVPRPVHRLTISIPASATLPADSPGELALSLDGSRLAYVGTENGLRQLYTRALDQLEAVPVRGAEGAYDPFFSPDGEWIGFFTELGPLSGKLKKIAVRGGPAIAVCEAMSATGGWWGEDGYIYFGTGNSRSPQRAVGVQRVAAAGGESTTVTKIDGKTESRHGWPQLLAGGKAILFSVRGATGLYDAGRISVLSTATGETRTIITSGFHARYIESGHIAYILGTTLMAVPFDVDRLEVTGSPVPIVERIPNILGRGQAGFAISSDGLLAYATGVMDTSARRVLVWTDRRGHEESIAAPPRTYLYPRVSPDGSRILLDVRDQQNDVWTWDIARRILTRLSFGPSIDRIPVWSPDGLRVAYTSDTGVLSQSADGSGESRRLADVTFPSAFTPDGKFIVSWGGVATDQIAIFPMEQQSQNTALKPLVAGRNADISPSGRWMAYESNESGRWEVYVRTFPNVHAGRWQISTEGGSQPVWSRTGRELFYRAPGGAVMAVAVQADESFRAASPAKLFEGDYFAGSTGNLARTYDVSADGKRFLMIREQPSTTPAVSPSLVAVLNWFAELKRLVPAN